MIFELYVENHFSSQCQFSFLRYYRLTFQFSRRRNEQLDQLMRINWGKRNRNQMKQYWKTLAVSSINLQLNKITSSKLIYTSLGTYDSYEHDLFCVFLPTLMFRHRCHVTSPIFVNQRTRTNSRQLTARTSLYKSFNLRKIFARRPRRHRDARGNGGI